MNERFFVPTHFSGMSSRIRQLALPVALTAVAVWVLAGCVYIPAFGPTVEGENASKSVGSKGSRKPIRVGRATVADVVGVLGEPPAATSDRRVLAYTWVVRNGYSIWPLCFAGYPVNGNRTLVMRFGEDGVLRSFEVLKLNDPVIQISAMGRQFPMPDEIERERTAQLREGARYRATAARAAPATAPSTAPVFQPR